MTDYSHLRCPAFCPICDCPMKGAKSTSAFYDWGCCMNCHIEFIEDREVRWKAGWRPSTEQVEQYLKKLNR